jgi:ATP-binding cassette subfamily B protein
VQRRDDLSGRRSSTAPTCRPASGSGWRWRTFFRDALLVILDEPTAAPDAKAEHELFARIGELFADRWVLLISHRVSTVRSADRIYVLSDGCVVESGAHEELLAAGIYAELFTLQASPYQ